MEELLIISIIFPPPNNIRIARVVTSPLARERFWFLDKSSSALRHPDTYHGSCKTRARSLKSFSHHLLSRVRWRSSRSCRHHFQSANACSVVQCQALPLSSSRHSHCHRNTGACARLRTTSISAWAGA